MRIVPPLSEAILLGAAITKAMPYHLDNCALGMAGNAIGLKDTTFYATQTPAGRGFAIVAAWPWLGQAYSGDNWVKIAETFNKEVANNQTMTMEQFVDMVREMEPKCSCHCFTCDCSAKVESPKEDMAYAETEASHTT